MHNNTQAVEIICHYLFFSPYGHESCTLNDNKNTTFNRNRCSERQSWWTIYSLCQNKDDFNYLTVIFTGYNFILVVIVVIFEMFWSACIKNRNTITVLGKKMVLVPGL